MLLYGALWFFLILASYYILRPIREQISATYGIENLSWLFWATFGVMLVAIPIYSALVGRFHRRRLVPAIYAFFIAGLLLFSGAMRYSSSLDNSDVTKMTITTDANTETPIAMQPKSPLEIWIARLLFIWISVYGLFIVSFFWSVVGDMLSTEQGRRLFGVMAGGGTVGGMTGSLIAGRLVKVLGIGNMLLIPALLLAFGLCVYFLLERVYETSADEAARVHTGQATGGNPFAGFTAVVKSRYLLAICCFGLLLATCGTTIYFQQSEIVREHFTTEEARTEYFAMVNLAVSAVTLLLQFIVVGWLMRTIGLGWTLAMLPLAYIVGISALAMSPTLAVLAIISVTGRSAEYGICNPAREVLFTAVKREERYKAKSFIDTVVRRAGDSAVGSLYHGLREQMGFAMSTLSWIAIPVAFVWAGLALFIGSENRLQAEAPITET